MHRAQGRRGEHGLRVALVALDLVLEPELLEQPEHSLGPRVVEVMDRDHRCRGGSVTWRAAAREAEASCRFSTVPPDLPDQSGLGPCDAAETPRRLPQS